MDDDSKMTFKVVNDKGEIITCDILFTFDRQDTGRSYIVYTDGSRDDAGNINVYASIYNPRALEDGSAADPSDLKLEPLQSEDEWKMVERILDNLTEQVREADRG